MSDSHRLHYRRGLFYATLRGVGAKLICLPPAALLIVALRIGCCTAISLAAQPPGKPPAQATPDPIDILDRFFGTDKDITIKAEGEDEGETLSPCSAGRRPAPSERFAASNCRCRPDRR